MVKTNISWATQWSKKTFFFFFVQQSIPIENTYYTEYCVKLSRANYERGEKKEQLDFKFENIDIVIGR